MKTPKSDDIQYSDRTVAFLDILGWSTATKALTSEIREVVRELHKISWPYSEASIENRKETGLTYIFSDDSEYVFASDSLYFSSPPKDTAFALIITATISAGLLQYGFLTRGGITFGPAYHRENIVLGPAVTEAARLDQSGTPPGIIVSKSVEAEIAKVKKFDRDTYIVDDNLGRRLLNIFATNVLPDPIPKNFDVDHYYREKLHIDDFENRVAANIAGAETPAHAKKWADMRDIAALMQQVALQALKRQLKRQLDDAP